MMRLNKQHTVSIKITVRWEIGGNTRASHVLLNLSNSGTEAVTHCFDFKFDFSRRGEGL